MRRLTAALAVLLSSAAASAQTAPEKEYARLCTGCHGEGATGTERGPALVNSRTLRNRSEEQIRTLIKTGTPGGMPAFALPDEQLHSLAAWVHSLNASAYDIKPAGDVHAGEQFFFGKGQCNTCHMVRGRGTANGPDLSNIGRQLTLRDIEQLLDNPKTLTGKRSSSSCPGWAFCPHDPWGVVNVRLRNGSTLRGFARGQGKHDLQLQTFDGKIHLLAESEYQSITREDKPYMPALQSSPQERTDLLAYLSRLDGIPVGPLQDASSLSEASEPRPGDWTTYNGNLGANRYSALHQINTANAGQLQLQWSYSIPYNLLETTPLVADGVMYVTGPNQVCALDSRSGHEIWCYSRPRTQAGTIAGDAAKGANRGSALLGDRIFFATDNAHLICLNRLTGGLMWDVVVPEKPGRYGSTAAPLVVGDLVITGVAGGDEGIRGFIAAFKASTGALAWRFWTVPARGGPGSETWKGSALEVGGGSTWVTGSYDAETGLLFWPTGNPFPDTDGDERGGDNLYTNCVVALDVKTGKLRWYFQFTPHDLHDWDATEPLLVV
ncbi:MAG: c-type cytochrome, partial [Bryobacteraceae bacterium]